MKPIKDMMTEMMEEEPCEGCKFGLGWDYEPEYGWVACTDCNDEEEKIKPTFKAWLNYVIFYTVLDALGYFKGYSTKTPSQRN